VKVSIGLPSVMVPINKGEIQHSTLQNCLEHIRRTAVYESNYPTYIGLLADFSSEPKSLIAKLSLRVIVHRE